MKKIIIHTDGACEGNPGPGGWAAILVYREHRRELSGATLATTNNRMEIQAAIEALKALKEPCEIQLFTDSEYLRDGITHWVPSWKRNGWKTKEKKAVKNMDLWSELDRMTIRHQITWKWLRGHAGNIENERCDTLAVQAIRKLRAQHSPQELAVALAEFREEQAAARPFRKAIEPGTNALQLSGD